MADRQGLTLDPVIEVDRTGLDLAPVERPVVDEQNRRRLLDKIVLGNFKDIISQSEIATELIDSLEGEDVDIKSENRVMLGSIFDIPYQDAILLEPAMIKELYGKPLEELSAAVVNKNLKEDIIGAVKETPENLWIGTIGMGAGTLEAIKRRAMQFAGGGIFPDEAIRHQFEAVTPALVPVEGSIERNNDLGRYAWDENKFDFIRPRKPFGIITGKTETGLPLPGTLAAEAFGVVTRLPDIGAKILRSKQRDLQEAQDVAEISNAPITKLSRLVQQSGVPSMGVAVGASLLTGNPLIGLAMLGETEGGAAFQRQFLRPSSCANWPADIRRCIPPSRQAHPPRSCHTRQAVPPWTRPRKACSPPRPYQVHRP